MRKPNQIEADQMLLRLQRKFQRKVRSEAERKESQRLRQRFSNFQNIDWDLIYEDTALNHR